MRDFLDKLCEMTPMDVLEHAMNNPPPPPPPPPEPPFTPPAGFKLVLRSYCAGHGDTRSHWVVEES